MKTENVIAVGYVIILSLLIGVLIAPAAHVQSSVGSYSVILS